jgi:hypothetical protein
MRLRFFAIALAAMLGEAHASSYQGTIQNVTPFGSRVFVTLTSGGFDGSASPCYTTAGPMVYSFDPSTALGKSIMATALSAKLTGKLVYVYGDGSCPSLQNPYNGQGSENIQGIDLKG